MNAIDYLLAHSRLAAAVGAGCLAISLCLIARLWVLHRPHSLGDRVAWSVVLLVPIFGWLFFAAFHGAASRIASDGHAEHGQAGHGSDSYGGAGGD